jgi:hypothetical protein
VLDAALKLGGTNTQWQRRVLNDGTSHTVFRRYFSATSLAEELGGKILHDGYWFVIVEA